MVCISNTLSRDCFTVHNTRFIMHTTPQAAIAAVPAEPQTRPGRGVGMYASAYQALSRMHGAVAEARAALMLNQTAQVCVCCVRLCVCVVAGVTGCFVRYTRVAPR